MCTEEEFQTRTEYTSFLPFRISDSVLHRHKLHVCKNGRSIIGSKLGQEWTEYDQKNWIRDTAKYGWCQHSESNSQAETPPADCTELPENSHIAHMGLPFSFINSPPFHSEMKFIFFFGLLYPVRRLCVSEWVSGLRSPHKISDAEHPEINSYPQQFRLSLCTGQMKAIAGIKNRLLLFSLF